MKNQRIFIAIAKIYIFLTITYILSSYTPNPYIKTIESVNGLQRRSVVFLPVVNKFNEKKLYDYIKQINIKFPDIVYAQAKLESANFTSDIFKENNNFFGMKCANKRAYLHKGENRGHAKYSKWEDCVIDYALYQATYLSDIKTEEEYYNYLSLHYAEDPNYVDHLKHIIKRSL